jgi:hypothetical protein
MDISHLSAMKKPDLHIAMYYINDTAGNPMAG